MLENLFSQQSVRSKQLMAPLLREREQYLVHLLSQEVSTPRVRDIASMLLHVIRLLKLDSPRIVHIEEIRDAAARWVHEVDPHLSRKVGPTSEHNFASIATRWLRHVNLIHAPILPERPIDIIVEGFVESMKQRRMYPPTIRTYRSRLLQFLPWALSRHEDISSVSLVDVDDFFELKRAQGCLPRSIGSLCCALKAFFRYTALRGIHSSNLSLGIRSPRISRYRHSRAKLGWRHVRLLLDSGGPTGRSDLRASAILFLCSIYGLRSSETANLTLDDFDWVDETFIVRRAKRGRTQQYPIQAEVGEAILRYLQNARPRSLCRSLFLTLQPPYRSVNPATFSTIIKRRIERFGLPLSPFGPHALRHACATELLRKGSSLQDIADFLGHRNLQSVCIYAKCDVRSLKKVAAFSLGGVR